MFPLSSSSVCVLCVAACRHLSHSEDQGFASSLLENKQQACERSRRTNVFRIHPEMRTVQVWTCCCCFLSSLSADCSADAALFEKLLWGVWAVKTREKEKMRWNRSRRAADLCFTLQTFQFLTLLTHHCCLTHTGTYTTIDRIICVFKNKLVTKLNVCRRHFGPKNRLLIRRLINNENDQNLMLFYSFIDDVTVITANLI